MILGRVKESDMFSKKKKMMIIKRFIDIYTLLLPSSHGEVHWEVNLNQKDIRD